MTAQSEARPIEILLVEDNLGDARLTQEALRDSRVINCLNHVKDGDGIIPDVPEDVGGWAPVDPGSSCTDTDEDGMPDEWEEYWSAQTGEGDLSPSGTEVQTSLSTPDAYTNIEMYFYGLASTLVPPP